MNKLIKFYSGVVILISLAVYANPLSAACNLTTSTYLVNYYGTMIPCIGAMPASQCQSIVNAANAACQTAANAAAAVAAAPPTPSALPTNTAGSANLLQKVGVPGVSVINNSPIYVPPKVTLYNEFHYVTTTQAVPSVAAYMPYVSCANGGTYTPGSLTMITPNNLYYFCVLPAYNAYFTNGTVYDSSTSPPLTYSAVLASSPLALASWNPPTLAGSNPYGASEKISINAFFANGLPLTTFKTYNCTNYINQNNGVKVPGTGCIGTSCTWEIVISQAAYNNAVLSTGLNNEVKTPAFANISPPNLFGSLPGPLISLPQYCGWVASTQAPVVTAQVLNMSVQYSFPFLGMNVMNLTPGIGLGQRGPGNFPYAPPAPATTAWPLTCSAQYTVQPGDMGNTVYLTCGCSSGTIGCATPVITNYSNTTNILPH